MAAINYNNASDIVSEIKTKINKDKAIIGIDGSVGAGKTILSYCLGCELKFAVINIDYFLDRHQGSYLDQIKFKELEDFIKFKTGSGKSIIIEGICLLKILSKIDIKHDVLLYVKRMSWNNKTWCEEIELNGNGKINTSAKTAEEKLINDIILYHNEFNPSVIATYCFQRIEEV